MLLSACMLTLNEVDHVRLSIPAILKIADEVVVIDGGSRDGTVEILREFGSRVRVEVEPQSGEAYTAGWEQEKRRHKIQDYCKGDWIIQIDADEFIAERTQNIRDIINSAPADTHCFGIWRLDYAPDLYHGFLPFSAHPPIPRIWRKGAVDWRTGKVVHMHPFRTGTSTPINKFPAPTYEIMDAILHHLHRAYWIGKSFAKRRPDETRNLPYSRSTRLSSFGFKNDYIPRALVPDQISALRCSQKKKLLAKLGVADDFERVQEDARQGLDAQNFFLPVNARKLAELIAEIPNPVMFVEIGSWLGGSTRFLAQQTGGCLIAIDHWKGSAEHQGREELEGILPQMYSLFLQNCLPYRDKIIPIRMSSSEAISLPIDSIDLLYVDGAHDYESVLADLRNWAPRVRRGGLICGDDWLWGVDQPVARAVKAYAKEHGHGIKSEGYFWWLERPS